MTATLDSADTIRRRLFSLTDLTERAAPILESNPFADDTPAWVADAQALADALLALDDAALDAFELDDVACRHLLRGMDSRYSEIEDLVSIEARTSPRRSREPAHVPGRKWRQIEAFAAAVPSEASHWVDWCAGKGHLGRTLAERGAEVRCVERDPKLCSEGRRLAGSGDVRFECRDVIAAPPELSAGEHVAALHACGHLHDALIERATEAGTAGVAIAPCCYHRSAAPEAPWQPLAATGPRDSLPATLVRFAVRETVTAPAGVRRRRLQERRYRLGYDALRRGVEHGSGTYRPLRSVRKAALADGFAAFCERAASEHAIALPKDVDFEHWHKEGVLRDGRARRLDLARTPFRRVLELRMVLDRALLLAERSYAVRVEAFCPRALTPRNLLILARRRKLSSPTERESG
jgi:hypothetical protein